MSSKVAQITKNLRHQKWIEEIRSCNNRPKGMTISQWCELNNVNLHSYYWHIHTLRQKGVDYAEAAGIDLSAPQTHFVELQPQATVSLPANQDSVSTVASMVSIQIGESVMNIPESVSDEFLQRIMNSLRS